VTHAEVGRDEVDRLQSAGVVDELRVADVDEVGAHRLEVLAHVDRRASTPTPTPTFTPTPAEDVRGREHVVVGVDVLEREHVDDDDRRVERGERRRVSRYPVGGGARPAGVAGSSGLELLESSRRLKRRDAVVPLDQRTRRRHRLRRVSEERRRVDRRRDCRPDRILRREF